MLVTNHFLTGAAIGKFLPWPIAAPLAYASHFALDSLPHFGFPTLEEELMRRKFLGIVLACDFVVAVAIATYLIMHGHMAMFYIGLVAFSPDLIWVYRFVVEERFGKRHPTEGNRFVKFHLKIQRYERVWGGFVELLYASLMFLVVK